VKAKSQLLAYHHKDAVVLKRVQTPYTVQETQRIWKSVERRIEKHDFRRLSSR
jgi:hypothetical protein